MGREGVVSHDDTLARRWLWSTFHCVPLRLAEDDVKDFVCLGEAMSTTGSIAWLSLWCPLTDVDIVSGTRLDPGALELTCQLLALLLAYLPAVMKRTRIVSGHALSLLPCPPRPPASSPLHMQVALLADDGTGDTLGAHVVEDLVMHSLDHLKARPRGNRVDEDVSVDANRML